MAAYIGVAPFYQTELMLSRRFVPTKRLRIACGSSVLNTDISAIQYTSAEELAKAGSSVFASTSLRSISASKCFRYAQSNVTKLAPSEKVKIGTRTAHSATEQRLCAVFLKKGMTRKRIGKSAKKKLFKKSKLCYSISEAGGRIPYYLTRTLSAWSNGRNVSHK